MRLVLRWLIGSLLVLAVAGLTPVSEATAASTGPVFAVTGYVHGRWTLIVGHVGGSSKTLVRAPSGILLQEPSVSHDGRRVAFLYGDSYGTHLAVLNTDGTN